MATKAVHIELVSDLTSEAFIAALRRFSARRGAPKNIYCDNGKNFVGARRILSEITKAVNTFGDIIAHDSAARGTQWHFIPPSAPNFGGLWEAGVKSVKSHLVKTIGVTHLTFEEMMTLLTQIEAVLNSRPLYAVVDDDLNYSALTPANFLIGNATMTLPDENMMSKCSSRLGIWQQIQQRVQSFWAKYKNDYLNTLNQRMKWKNKTSNLKLGDIVLLKSDNAAVGVWTMGKIIAVHPGIDDIVRVASVKTKDGIYKRPVSKICTLLPEDSTTVSNQQRD